MAILMWVVAVWLGVLVYAAIGARVYRLLMLGEEHLTPMGRRNVNASGFLWPLFVVTFVAYGVYFFVLKVPCRWVYRSIAKPPEEAK